MSSVRCRDCGQFIKGEYTEPDLCDLCLDRKWDEFMEGAAEQRDLERLS